MNDEIKEILSDMLHIICKYGDDFDDLEENEIRYQLPYTKMEKIYDYITNLQTIEQQYSAILSENAELENKITNLQQENERLKQNQVNALNRIRDFINTSKCEILEGSYCNDMHSQYWEMFIQFAEELKKKIKGLDTKDYVYISKWREQELLSQEEQLEDYKSRIEKAVEYIGEYKDYCDKEVCDCTPEYFEDLLNILNGKE